MKTNPDQPQDAAELRRRAEDRLQTRERNPQSAIRSPQSMPDTQRLVHELRVHQIELEMQNEELRRAQHELEVSREKYFDLYDLAPVGYLTLNEPGLILEANLTATRLLGVARTDLLQQPLTRSILREDLGIFHQHRQQLFETGAPQSCELRLTRPGGAPFWVRGEAILAQDHKTGAPVCRMMLSDLTERKQAEADRERLAQFERLAQLMKCASDIVLLADEHGRILEANDRALEIYGYSLAELRQKTLEDLRTPESRAELPHQIEQLETDGRGVFEAMNQRRDGTAFPVEISARVLEIAGVRHRLGIVRDITERKWAEAALRESETRFRELFSHMSSGVAVYEARNDGQDFVFKDFNRAAERIEATPREAVLGRSVVEVFPGVKEFGLFNVLQRVWRTGQPEHPATGLHRDKHIVGWRENQVYRLPNGEIVAVYDDITQRQRAEAALRESEETMRYMVKYDPNAIAIYDLNLHYLAVSDRYLQDYNVKEENVIGKHHYEVFPELPQRWKDVHQRCLSGAIERNDDDYFERPDGSITYNRWECRPWYRGDGTIGGMITYTEVTTERKKAEIALRESERRHRAILRTALDGFWRVGLRGRLLEVNEAYCRMSGYSEQELLTMHTPDLEAVEAHADTAAHLQRVLARGEDRFETRHRRKDGSTFAVEISVQYKPAEGGQVIAFLRDITERKRAEKKMQMFSQEIIAAREDERKQVSSVLHHDVGSLTVGISAHLDAVEQDLRSGKPGEALKWMKRTRKLFGESVARLKKLAIELRPPELDVLGLHAALRQYFSQVTERGGTRIHFRETLGRRRVSGDTATILFRVAQEAVTNAITHGHATRVDVGLSASKKEVGLTIRNNGKGFNPSEQRAQATSQIGLRVMHEMAVSVGGTFTLDSGRGKRTTVRVRLPLKAAVLGPGKVTARDETVARGMKTRSAGRGSRPQKGSRA